MTRKKTGFQSINSVLRDVARMSSMDPLECTFRQEERIQQVLHSLRDLLSADLLEKIDKVSLYEERVVLIHVCEAGTFQGLNLNRGQIVTELKKRYSWVHAVKITQL